MALSNYLQMVSWKRPSGSFEAKVFGEVFLAPIMGQQIRTVITR